MTGEDVYAVLRMFLSSFSQHQMSVTKRVLVNLNTPTSTLKMKSLFDLNLHVYTEEWHDNKNIMTNLRILYYFYATINKKQLILCYQFVFLRYSFCGTNFILQILFL